MDYDGLLAQPCTPAVLLSSGPFGCLKMARLQEESRLDDLHQIVRILVNSEIRITNSWILWVFCHQSQWHTLAEVTAATKADAGRRGALLRSVLRHQNRAKWPSGTCMQPESVVGLSCGQFVRCLPNKATTLSPRWMLSVGST